MLRLEGADPVELALLGGPGAAPCGAGRERAGLAVALQQAAHERRADGEPLGDFGGAVTVLAGLEDPGAEVHRKGSPGALLGKKVRTSIP